MVLHHVPVEDPCVLHVHIRGLDELAADLLLDVVSLLGVQMTYDSVDHFCACLGRVLFAGDWEMKWELGVASGGS